MAVPRNRTSNARKNSRRSHHAKKPTHFATCPNCEKPKIAHRMCDACGHYNGKAVITKETQ